MPMCVLIEFSNNYSKTLVSLQQYCRDDLAGDDNNCNIVEFTENNTTDLFKTVKNNRIKRE